MQLSMRSSRLAPLVKCPRDTIIRNWVIWARLGCEGKGLFAALASSLALGAALEPWGVFLGKKKAVRTGRVARDKLAAQGSGGRPEKRSGDKTINPRSWTDRNHTPPTWQLHQMDWLAVKETSSQQMTGKTPGLQ